MKSSKKTNFFLLFIVIILGATLFKHFNFKTFQLKDPLFDNESTNKE